MLSQSPPTPPTDPKLLELYNATPLGGRSELLAKINAGGQMEELQAIVIHWMMKATAGAHDNV